MGSPTESPDQWAARMGPILDEDAWRRAALVVEHGIAEGDERRFNPDQVALARALLAFRSRLAAGLSDGHRQMLLEACEHGGAGLNGRGRLAIELCARSLVRRTVTFDGDCTYTALPLGREIARVLEARDA